MQLKLVLLPLEMFRNILTYREVVGIRVASSSCLHKHAHSSVVSIVAGGKVMCVQL